jgi:hypothetical protein
MGPLFGRWLIGGVFFCIINGFAQIDPQVPVHALVYPDSASSGVFVRDIHLDVRFAGYGVYVPSEYPTLSCIPLENGERVTFDAMSQLTAHARRVHWKTFVEPANRHQYSDVNPDGYRYWSGVEVDVTITGWDGKVIHSRIQRPEVSDVYLSGTTDHGDFRLQLDQENNKTVRVQFDAKYIMQCTDNLKHLFPNMNWKFCPSCGAPLKRINKPAKK